MGDRERMRMSRDENQNIIAMAQRHFARVWGAVVNCEVPEKVRDSLQNKPFDEIVADVVPKI
jgi:hypothetical protein